jgi:hypothetical protein
MTAPSQRVEWWSTFPILIVYKRHIWWWLGGYQVMLFVFYIIKFWKCSTTPPWHQALRFRGHPTTRRARDNLETLGVESGIQGRQYGRRWQLLFILDGDRNSLILPYHWGWVDAPNRIPLNGP